MKNVAGYDVGKLFIGSLGTLGAIVEVTLRLFALPEKRATLLLPSNSLAEAFDLANRAIGLSAAGVQIIDPVSAKHSFEKASWLTAIDLLGDEEVVKGQVGVMTLPGAIILENEHCQLCWDTIAGLTNPRVNDWVVGRASLPPAALKSWVEEIIVNCSAHIRFVICPGTGRAWVISTPDKASSEILTSLRVAANRLEGYFTIEAAPQSGGGAWPVWDEAGVDGALLKGIKQVFDPNHILAPGSFLGGI
jgi:glycolate oxidase FAD binding subunit